MANQDLDPGDEYNWDDGPLDRSTSRWILAVVILAAIGALLVIAAMATAKADELPMPKFQRADLPCMSKQDALKTIMGPNFREVPLFTGSLGNKHVGSLVTANIQTGTWTLFAASPDGAVLCIVLSGEHFSPADLSKLIGPKT